MSPPSDLPTPEFVAFFVRHWLDGTRLQLDRVTDPVSEDHLDADVDFLAVAMYQLDRACRRAGDPLPELQLVTRIRHEVEHPENRHPNHVYITGDDIFTLWSWALGHRGKLPAGGATVEVIEEARTAISHATALAGRLPEPLQPHLLPEGETIDSLADAAARVINEEWGQPGSDQS